MTIPTRVATDGPGVVAARPAADPPARSGFILGLDGLRALSVLAVLCYHAGFEWMRGGFLGVEVFFVLSGFLITGLLLKEHEASGCIDLGQFWRRRMRRLVPALLGFLLAMSTYGVVFLGAQASQFRLDLLASLGYLENWYQIGTGNSYFADQGLPLLRHLWSLAVEGQFYLAWPLLVALALGCSGGRRRVLAALTILLALVSFGLMLVLGDPGNPSQLVAMGSINRVYLGTDTRMLGLLAGALLALAPRPRLGAWAGRALDLAAGTGLLLLGLLMAGVEYQKPFLYRGGFLLVDGLTALVIVALILPRTRPGGGWLRRGLGCPPLEWIGQRSYGLYLWHWPVLRLLGPHGAEAAGWWFPLRLLVAGLLTEASYRWLEVPVRQGCLRRWQSRCQGQPRFWRRQGLRVAVAVLVLFSLWETTALARRAPYVDPVQASIQAGAAALDNAGPEPAPCVRPEPVPAVPEAAGIAKPVRREPLPPPPGPPTMPEDMDGVRLTAVGDSVMKGAAIALKKMGEASLGEGMIQINAEECRPFSNALEVLRHYRAENRLGEVVVIHLGTNNSSISEEQFHRLMTFLADRRLVLFLTARSDKVKACEAVNRSLEALVAPYANARVFDWKAEGDAHPAYFYSDQTHLRPEAAAFYAVAILNQVALPAGKKAERINVASRTE